jgi:hypothetical protein
MQSLISMGLSCPNHSTAHDLALACLDGDASALDALHDCLSEMEEPMLKVGQKYLIRTVSNYFTGEVIYAAMTHVVLKNAAWIPDTGRFHECFNTGVFREVEPYPQDAEVIVNLAAVVDATVWKHSLPAEAV